MFGGNGNDTYHVDDAGDVLGESFAAGTDTVVTTFTNYTLSANVENLTYTGAVRASLFGNGLDNVITGGSAGDLIDASQGGADSGFGMGGDDAFSFDGTWSAGDRVDGGQGEDQLALRGDYAGLVFAEDAMVSIEGLKLFAGQGGASNSYDITTSDGNVAAGETLMIKGNKLAASEGLSFDGSAELDGGFQLRGGAGDDVMTGGAGSDLFVGKRGADQLTGNGGADVFAYTATGDSNAAARDTILDFAAGDVIHLGGIDAVPGGANDAFHWAPGYAFTNTAGELTLTQSGGEWLLAGDTNGDGVADLVVGIVGAGGYEPLQNDVLL